MYDSESATVSKNLFIGSCGLALIILLGLVWCLVELSKKPTDRSPFDDVAAMPEARFVAVINADSSVAFFSPDDGTPVKPCGTVNGTKVEGDCNIKGELENHHVVTVSTFAESPGCTAVYSGSGAFLFWRCT